MAARIVIRTRVLAAVSRATSQIGCFLHHHRTGATTPVMDGTQKRMTVAPFCRRFASLSAAAAHPSLLQRVDSLVRAAALAAYPAAVLPSTLLVSASRQEDYQSNVALLLAKQLKIAPGLVAETLRVLLQAQSGVCSSSPAAGGDSSEVSAMGDVTVSNGFINFKIPQAFVDQEIFRLSQHPYPQHPQPLHAGVSAGRVLVDFSSPNMGKELHVGHLRSSVIGDSLARTLEYCGYTVDRRSHVGDAGVPVALLLAAYDTMDAGAKPKWMQMEAQPLIDMCRTLAREAEKHVSSSDLASSDMKAFYKALPPPSELSRVYAEAKRHADSLTDNTFALAVQQTLSKLQQVLQEARLQPQHSSPAIAPAAPIALPAAWDLSGVSDKLLFARWLAICTASKIGISPLLKLLDVSVVEAGESSYLPLLKGVVQELVAKNVAVATEGALGVFTEGTDKPPMLVRKGDGAYLYATIDMAALRFRLQAGYDRIIYVTDMAQSSHFRQLFTAARLAGWLTPTGANALCGGKPVTLDHAYFGVVTGENGKKLSSRAGVDYPLASLLDDGIAHARKQLTQVGAGATATGRSSDKPVSPAGTVRADDGQISRDIACSAIRYFDLSHNRKTKYEFTFDKVLSMKGNTAAYLLYSTTRLASLRRQLSKFLPVSAPAGTPSWPDIIAAMEQVTGTPQASWRVSCETDSERALGLQILRLPELLEHSLTAASPNVVTDYLFTTATAFHGFYEQCRIAATVADDSRLDPGSYRTITSRILLCKAADDTLHAGYKLVGLTAVDRM